MVFGLLAAAGVQWGVAPRILPRQDLAFWHGLGILGMVVHAVCGVGVFLRVVRSLVIRSS